MATTITLLVQRPYLRRLPRILLPQKATEGHIIFHIGPFGPYICPITYPFFVYTYICVLIFFVQKPYLRRLPRILLPKKATSYFTLDCLGPIFAQLLSTYLFYLNISHFLYKDHISAAFHVREGHKLFHIGPFGALHICPISYNFFYYT
jgi:hypothetical protein